MTTQSYQNISFTRGIPPDEMLPQDLIARGASQALATYGTKALQYGPSWGFQPLREWLSDYLACPVEQIITGNGSINLLAYLVEYLVQPGDVVLVENPTYDRARVLLEKRGAKVLAVETDDDGPDPDQLESLLRAHRPRLFYLIPDFNNPSGVCTSLERRQAIAALAQEHDLLLVEDSAYYDLRFDDVKIPRLRQFAPEHCVTLGSFSKLIAPGLRTGWMMLPGHLAKDLAQHIQDASICPVYFSEACVAQIVQHADYAIHLKGLITTYRGRRDAMLRHLAAHLGSFEARWNHPQGGFFIGLWLPPTERPIWEISAAEGLSLLNGDGFFVGREKTNFVRLPFCSLNDDQMEAGMARMARLLLRSPS